MSVHSEVEVMDWDEPQPVMSDSHGGAGDVAR